MPPTSKRSSIPSTAKEVGKGTGDLLLAKPYRKFDPARMIRLALDR